MFRSTEAQQHTGHLSVVVKGREKSVPWICDKPQGTAGSLAVCLLHGASGDGASGNLPALAEAIAGAGFPCLRLTTRGSNLDHRVAVVGAALAQAGSLPGLDSAQGFVLAGHSMGARVACTLAAQSAQQRQPSSSEEQEGQQQQQAPVVLPPILACMLFSYPLHPPGKPEQQRDALLTQLPVPALLVRGTRDPFSQPELWDATLARMLSPSWEQHSVEGGDHGLRISGREGASTSEAELQEVCAAAQRFLRQVAAQALATPLAQQTGHAAATGEASSLQPGRSETAAKKGTGSASRAAAKKRSQPVVPGAAKKRKQSAAAAAAAAAEGPGEAPPAATSTRRQRRKAG